MLSMCTMELDDCLALALASIGRSASQLPLLTCGRSGGPNHASVELRTVLRSPVSLPLPTRYL